MNAAREAILRYLASRGMWFPTTTHTVAAGCGIGYDDAERELLALDVLGLAELAVTGWELSDAGRAFVAGRMAG